MRFVLLRGGETMPYNKYTMEQHPVPQNVTTFQFRLIGDMTIKQFGYLAGGAILAYISYRLPLPFFFTWPLTIVFGLGGVGFAFVPIEERPMDIWVLSFIKSIYSPTQYVWQQQIQPPPTPAAPAQAPAPVAANVVAQPAAPPLAAAPSSRTKSDVLQSVFTPSVPKPQAGARVVSTHQQTNLWGWLLGIFSPAPAVRPVAQGLSHTNQFSTPSVVGKRIDLSPPPVVAPKGEHQQKILQETKEKEEALEQKLSTLRQDLENKTITEARILELQKQLTEVLAQKEKMQQELEAFRRQSVPPAAAAATPVADTSASHVATPRAPHAPTVKIITQEGAVKAGLPRLTTFPNVVTGIIKDSENNLLPGVLVTVKDKDSMPLRALKTNRLGQFAASTPLANGVYFVEIEDPRLRFTFDRVQISLNGSVVPAIEIIAKSQKQINRAMLEKELFGKQP
jgi:hypothetical protein